jgi:hypothetical protein
MSGRTGLHDPAAPRSLYAPGDAGQPAAPAARLLTRDECEALAKKLLAFAKADETRVTIQSAARGNTRFAVNQVSTAGDSYDAAVVVRSVFGRRAANAVTNKLDDASLRAVVERAEALARLAPEDPEYVAELGPQQYAESTAYAAGTAALDAAGRAAAVRAVTEPARGANLVATGYLETQAGATAVANSKGLFAYNRQTGASMTTTVRTPDGTGSGWAGAAHQDWGKIDAAALGARAIDKARRSASPVAVEPGRYTVVLEPTAVGNLLQLMAFAMNARTADEGRSFFTKQGGGNKIGQKVVDERVTITSDPADPDAPAGAFTGDGLPDAAHGVDRERRGQEPRLRPLLGAAAEPRAGAARAVAPHVGRHRVARGDDRLDRARAARHAPLVHPPRRPAHDPLHGAHARRHVPHRARQDHARGQEPAVEREPRLHAQQRRGDGAPGAGERERGREPGRGGGGAAGQGARLHVHVAQRRGVGPPSSAAGGGR